MATVGFTEKLARMSTRRPWLVVGIWALVFIAGGFFGSGISDVLTTETKLSAEPDSVKGQDLIDDRFGPDKPNEFVIVRSADRTADSPEFRTFVENLTADLSELNGTVEQAVNYYQTNSPNQVSRDRHTTVIAVTLAGNMADAEETVAPLLDTVNAANGMNGYEVLSAGTGSVAEALNTTSESDLQKGEMIALPIAILILLLVFGAVIAAGVPLIVAIVSIVIAVGISAIIGEAFDLSFFVVNMITMIGMAVGIDYSLFIIHRVRDERAAGLDTRSAVSRAGATASRAVLFSGATVVVALAGLFIVPSNVFRSLAIGGIAVVVVSVAAALTLLPAILGLLGDRVNALRLPFVGRGGTEDGARGFWERFTNLVMAHPVISTGTSVAILLVATVPLLTIQLGMAGVSNLPDNTEARRAFDILDTDFAGGVIAPTKVVIDGDATDPEVQAGVDALVQRMSGDGSFSTPVVEENDAGTLIVVSAAVLGDPDSSAAHDAIHRVRDQYVPAAFDTSDVPVYVTGQTASSQDLIDVMTDYMPIVFAFVLGVSFVLLLVLFRSIVVPVKAILMNLLSVGAAYGLIVLVFQHGVGADIFGFQRAEAIEAWLPLFLFAVLFGLSMDYHVFLLSRIKERFDETGDNTLAVAHGMRSTSSLITGAALIMVTVFAGFATGQLGAMQQMGFGLAVAVILDATIIRCVLVPASMQLLGNRNWYMPNWMAWLPEISLEGAGSPLGCGCVDCGCTPCLSGVPA
jgi:putative drug exporter of the RND superfamily